MTTASSTSAPSPPTPAAAAAVAPAAAVAAASPLATSASCCAAAVRVGSSACSRLSSASSLPSISSSALLSALCASTASATAVLCESNSSAGASSGTEKRFVDFSGLLRRVAAAEDDTSDRSDDLDEAGVTFFFCLCLSALCAGTLGTFGLSDGGITGRPVPPRGYLRHFRLFRHSSAFSDHHTVTT